MVAKGYVQTHDIDYDETFTPVAKMTRVCVVLVVIAAGGWHLHQMEVKNTFLQVFMIQPPGFQSKVNKSTVCRLRKSLYSLKQAPCAWISKITQRLHKMGFVVSKSDSSLFIQKGPKGLVCILLYLDAPATTLLKLAK